MNVGVYCQFTKNGVPTAPADAPTVSVYSMNKNDSAIVEVETNQATTAIGSVGGYGYFFTAEPGTYDYLAYFTTTDTTTGLDSTVLPYLLTDGAAKISANSAGQVGLDFTNVNNPDFPMGTVSTVTSASEFIVSFPSAIDVTSLDGMVLDFGFASAITPPNVLPIATLSQVDSDHIQCTFSIPFGSAPTSGQRCYFSSPGVNTDENGNVIGAANLMDAVVIETGCNARQVLSIIGAASGGVVSGQGTGIVNIKGIGVPTVRITAETDGSNNRTTVTPNLPT
jgi:hypothetical protein